MKNIVENNKLLAEFLGGIKQPFEFPQFGYINSMGDWKDTFFDNQLKFHSDWNWLMQVVEKIENLSKEGETYMFSITKFSARVTYKGSRIVDLPIDNTKIEAVYNACVEFIKWYNQQSKI